MLTEIPPPLFQMLTNNAPLFIDIISDYSVESNELTGPKVTPTSKKQEYEKINF